MYSKLVEEVIWLVPTHKHKAQVFGDEAVYTVDELQLINDLSKKVPLERARVLAKKIHNFKKS